MNRSIWLVTAAALLVSGCATASFAPPPVRTTNKVADHGPDCEPNIAVTGDRPVAIYPNVIGAIDLMDNYEAAYACAEAQLANGRQIFEVPVFLATAAGLAGAQFGLDADAVLAAGIYSAVLKGGDTYYAPRQKAEIVSDARKAIACLQAEAVDISYFRTDRASQDRAEGPDPAKMNALRLDHSLVTDQLSTSAALAPGDRTPEIIGLETQLRANQLALANALAREWLLAQDESPRSAKVPIDVERQYFQMVKSALTTVHLLLGERLRDAGSSDASGMFDQLKALVEEARQTEQDAKGAEGPARAARQAAQAAMANAYQAQANAAPLGFTESESRFVAALLDQAMNLAAIADDKEAIFVELETKALQPKLQACVLMARAS